ncbi:diacylglycerol acyltransferase [Nannochloropsis oceanica]
MEVAAFISADAGAGSLSAVAAAAATVASRRAKEAGEATVRRQQLWKLKGFLALYTTLLVVSFALTVWADLTWLVPQLLKVSLALQATSAVFFCLVVPLTHFSGTFFFRQWRFWQPFQGGARFIVFQAISWTFYALCLVLAVCCLLFWARLAKYTFGLITSFGVFGVLSQVFMVTSLVVYERQQHKQWLRREKDEDEKMIGKKRKNEEERIEEEEKKEKKESSHLPICPSTAAGGRKIPLSETAATTAAEDEEGKKNNDDGNHHVQQLQQQDEEEKAGGGLIRLLQSLYKEIFFQHHLALAIVAVGLAILAECLWTMEEGGTVGVWGGMVEGHQKDFARAAGLLSVLLFAVVVFSTYGIGGQVAGGREGRREGGREGRAHQKAVRKQWRFWQPFLGGAKFMLLQGLSWSFLTLSIVVEILFVISTFAVGFELFVGAAVVAGGFFLVSEVLMIVSLHFYMPTTTTTVTTTGLTVMEKKVEEVEEMLVEREGVEKDEMMMEEKVDVTTAATTNALLRTGKQRLLLAKESATTTTTTVTMTTEQTSKTSTSFMPVRVDEASLEQFRRLTVITVLSNMQYLPFLLPILPFILSGLPLPVASLHWFGAFCCLTSAVVLNAYVKTTLAKAGHRLNSFQRSLLHALPSLIYAAPGVICFFAWKQHQGGRGDGKQGAVSAFPAWAVLTAMHYLYLFLTFRGKPEVTGERYLGEKLELWKGGWSLYYFLEGIDQYFQARFVFMDPNLDLKGKPHVLAFHPHGVQPFTTCWIQLSRAWREGVGKGQRFCVMTASVMHYVPLMRDILQWLGGREVSREAISYALGRRESVLLVPGGQQEMMESQSQMGEIRIITKHVGFIRLALQTGAPLVPVLSFGEVEVMDFVRYPRLQRFFISRIGIPVPFFPYGLFGFPIPRPVPVTVVFGRPIPVEKVEQPTQEEVRKLSKKYFESIQEVFDKNKTEALGHGNHRLVLL